MKAPQAFLYIKSLTLLDGMLQYVSRCNMWHPFPIPRITQNHTLCSWWLASPFQTVTLWNASQSIDISAPKRTICSEINYIIGLHRFSSWNPGWHGLCAIVAVHEIISWYYPNESLLIFTNKLWVSCHSEALRRVSASKFFAKPLLLDFGQNEWDIELKTRKRKNAKRDRERVSVRSRFQRWEKRWIIRGFEHNSFLLKPRSYSQTLLANERETVETQFSSALSHPHNRLTVPDLSKVQYLENKLFEKAGMILKKSPQKLIHRT